MLQGLTIALVVSLLVGIYAALLRRARLAERVDRSENP